MHLPLFLIKIKWASQASFAACVHWHPCGRRGVATVSRSRRAGAFHRGGLPLESSETQNVAWKVAVPGRGWSSPVVAGGRIWLTTAVTDRGTSLRALAYNAENGREMVNVEVFRIPRTELLNFKNSHASPSAIVDGDRVYVHFGAEGTAALTTSGEIVWTSAVQLPVTAWQRRIAGASSAIC